MYHPTQYSESLLAHRIAMEGWMDRWMDGWIDIKNIQLTQIKTVTFLYQELFTQISIQDVEDLVLL